ncbi:hypothetical protein PENTCL1PPCAC_21008, partial [Pristionchus entomophagus]
LFFFTHQFWIGLLCFGHEKFAWVDGSPYIINNFNPDHLCDPTSGVIFMKDETWYTTGVNS